MNGKEKVKDGPGPGNIGDRAPRDVMLGNHTRAKCFSQYDNPNPI